MLPAWALPGRPVGTRRIPIMQRASIRIPYVDAADGAEHWRYEPRWL
jgi:hypothetical protein